MNLLRKVSFLLAGVLLAFPVLAEGNKFEAQITSAKKYGKTFARANVFTRSVGIEEVHTKGQWNAYQGAASILAEATLTSIDRQALAAAHATAPEYLRLRIPFRKSADGGLELELFKVDIFTHDFEADYNIYQNKGSVQAATNWVLNHGSPLTTAGRYAFRRH